MLILINELWWFSFKKLVLILIYVNKYRFKALVVLAFGRLRTKVCKLCTFRNASELLLFGGFVALGG